MTPNDIEILGQPPAAATHWGVLSYPRGRGSDETVKLAFASEGGVMAQRWPIEQLSVEEVRRRWGPGVYRTQWFSAIDGKWKVCGQGCVVEFAPNTEEPDTDPTPAAAPGDTIAQYIAIQRMAQEQADRRVQEILTFMRQAPAAMAAAPAAAPTAETEAMREELARLRQQLAVQEQADKIRAEFRAELERRDARIAELERETDDASSAPLFTPGEPIAETLVTAALNAVAKNPSALATVLAAAGPILEKLMNKGNQAQALPQAPAAPQTAPAPESSPAPTPTPRPRPTVVLMPQTPRTPPPEPEPSPEEREALYGKPAPMSAPATADGAAS